MTQKDWKNLAKDEKRSTGDFEIQHNSTTGLYEIIHTVTNDRVQALSDQAFLFNITSISSNYTTSGNDTVILCDTSSNSITVTIASSNVQQGRSIIIKDSAGNALSNNITIQTEGSETIDGQSSQTIGSDHGASFMFSDGSDWFIVGGSLL